MSNAEIARNTHAPFGFRRHGGICSVSVLALLDDDHRHRLRRAAWHLPPRRSERGPFQYSDTPLDHEAAYFTYPPAECPVEFGATSTRNVWYAYQGTRNSRTCMIDRASHGSTIGFLQ